MNKILLFTDPHFCSYSSIVRKRGKKYSMRLENQLETIRWLQQVAKSEDCAEIFCLGDFFDRPELNAEELTALSEIEFGDVPFDFIVGNHEMGSADLTFSSSHSFLLNTHSLVYDKPAIVGLGNTMIYILPYQLEIDRLDDVMQYFPRVEIPESIKFRILLMHNDISGIQMGKFISKEGFSIENLSSNFDLVVNGHLHNQQWIAKNVLNLGNITGQNFSEDAFKYRHQALLIDCDTLDWKLIDNPYALNFYKLDFTTNSDIDSINKISSMISRNGVIFAKVNLKDEKYVRYRFDPDYHNEEFDKLNLPRNQNIIQSRIIIDREVSCSSESFSNDVTDLHLDHLQEFQRYILEELGNDDLVLSELQEVIR